ncbi:MAG TPA: hypothetical protein VGM87_05080 [Roseomonas sp.]
MRHAATPILACLALAPASAARAQTEPPRVSAILTCGGMREPLPIVFVAGDAPTAMLDWQGVPVTLAGVPEGVGPGMRYTARLDAGLLAITASRDEASVAAPGVAPAHCRLQRR